MTKNNLKILIITLFLPICFSCKESTREIKIGDSSAVKISGDFGDLNLQFQKGSMSLAEIEIKYDKKDFQVKYEIDQLDLIKSQITRRGKESLAQNYISFQTDPIKTILNDSSELEIIQKLITNHIIKKEGNIFYIGTYENGVKVYNSLNLKVIDAVSENPDEIKILLRNDFPFEGNFNFYKYDTKTKLEAKKIENNLYSVVYKGIKSEENILMLDVEILPLPIDTLVRSTFTQRIKIKQ